MKKWLISLIVVLLMVSSVFPLVTGPGGGYTVIKFSDGSQAKNITIPAVGGSDGTNSIELPKTAVVTEAHFNVTGLTGPGETNPSGVSIDVGNDGDFEWNFSGTGYGPLGNQSLFSDGNNELFVNFQTPGSITTGSIYLPKNATVTDTMAKVVGGGGGTSRLSIWDDDFSTDKGWSLGTNWQRGQATSSTGHNYGNPDPANDHTPTSDDMIIGCQIGGNVGAPDVPQIHGFYYATSPIIDCSSYTNVNISFYRWLNSDYTPYIQNEVSVYDGSTWQIVWQSGSIGIQDNSWNQQEYDVSTYADGNSIFRMRMGYNVGSSGVFTVSGWNVDDVDVTADGPGTDNASIDFGDDLNWEWNHTGEYLGIEYMADFTSNLNALISAAPIALTDAWGNDMVEIPINITANSTGLLRIQELGIRYDYTTTVDINPFTGNLTNELNLLLPHTGEGNMTVPLMVSCAPGGIVNISNIFIDYYIPPVTNDALYLTNGHGLDGKICYSQYEDYIFRANVSSRNGYHDISDVTLTLGLGTYNITFMWNRTSDTFIEVNDPNDYVELVSTSCTSWTDLDTRWSLDFVVDLHWSYPDEVLTTCQLNTSSNSFFPIENQFFEIYRVENDLDLFGMVSAVAAVQGTLSSGDWVLGNETVNWTGLTVVYQGTTNLYPDDAYFNVTITNDTGHFWMDMASSGSQFDIETQVDPLTDHSDVHHIDITEIPGAGQDISSVTFEIKVDATAPAPPAGIICHADGPGIGSTVFDKDTTVYVSWSGGPWQDTQSGKLDDAMAYNDPYPITYSNPGDPAVGMEGNSTFYVRTRDMVGNWGIAGSSWIFIDLTPIVFTNPLPDPLLWHTDDDVQVGLTMTDTGGSGVAAATIQYRYTGDGLLDNEIWTNYAGATSSQSVVVSQLIDFGYDGDKLVQWRAKDVANADSTDVTPYIVSPQYPLRIDSTLPTIDFVSPFHWQRDTSVPLKLYINDSGGSFVDKTTIEYIISTTGPDGFGTAWNSLGETGEGETVLVELDGTFEEGTENYIKWRASDVAGNEIESDAIQIKVDTRSPSYSNLVPGSGEWQLDRDITAGITLHENNSGLDYSSMEYRITKSGPGGFLPWESIPLDAIDITNSINLRLSFNEGSQNAIQWRVKDMAGNVMETSPIWIKVDTLQVSFNTPVPDPQQWQITNDVECRVGISDVGSGVDVSSIQYSISTTGISGFGDWKDASLSDDDANNITAVKVVELLDGSDNFIQWRASDVAGNDYEVSPPYKIKVDTTPVSFIEPLPLPDKVHISQSQVVGITIEDPGSGVEPQTIHYSFSYGGNSNWGEWTSAGITTVADPSKVSVTKALDVPPARDTYIKWKATDVAGNEMESAPFNIQIDAPPVAMIASPVEDDEFNTSSSVMFDGTTSYDPDGDELSYSWNIGGKLYTTSTYETTLSLGQHSIVLTVTDPYGLTSFARVNVTIVAIEVPDTTDNDSGDGGDGGDGDGGIPDGDGTGDTDKGEGDGDDNLWWLILIAIIVVVCVLLLLVVIKRKKDREAQAAQAIPPVAVGTQPHVQPAYMAQYQGPAQAAQFGPPAETYQLPQSTYSSGAGPVAALPPARFPAPEGPTQGPPMTPGIRTLDTGTPGGPETPVGPGQEPLPVQPVEPVEAEWVHPGYGAATPPSGAGAPPSSPYPGTAPATTRAPTTTPSAPTQAPGSVPPHSGLVPSTAIPTDPDEAMKNIFGEFDD